MAGNNLVNADFSPYSRMFFAVKQIYLTLYIAYTYRAASTYSIPIYLAPRARWRSLSVLFAVLACPRPCAWPCGRARCAVHLLAYVLAALACPRPCVRLLMPGQRWTFLSAVPVWPALLARFPCACGRARARVCVGAVRLPSSRLPCILFAYNVHSPPLCQACPPRFHPAANFFEIVFKPSISIPPSLSWVDDATLYCYAGYFVSVVML